MMHYNIAVLTTHMCRKMGRYLDWGLLLNRHQANIQTNGDCTLQISHGIPLNRSVVEFGYLHLNIIFKVLTAG